MSRWRNVVVAACLTASACDEGEDPRVALPADSSAGHLDGGVPVIYPAPDSGAFAQPEASLGSADTGVTLEPEAGVSLLPEAGASAQGLGAANPCGADPEPFAANIKVRELALYQTVKVPLYRDNAWVSARNAAVVQGKKSLLRAFVDPAAGFAPRALRGVLSLDTNGVTTVLSAERNVTRASTDEASDSTFDFAVDGALIAGDTKLSFSLLETTCVASSAAPGTARLPASGAQALNADANGTLHVVIVPITLAGRTPDTSEAQLNKVRDALRAFYPVADVEVTAHAPISYGGAVQASGTGWTEVLMQVTRQRQQDAPAANVYYFGWITPAASFREYCRSGCVLGLAPQTSVISRSGQVGLGIGYADENNYITVVHELGHAHGLPHAPCVPRGGEIEGSDRNFPYTGAKIGSWGWDSRSDKLMSPATYVDVMSYCDPAWISDYNYQKIATRSKAVNNAAFVHQGEKRARQTWHGVILYADGSARWSDVTLHEQPGELISARALDARGTELATVDVARVPLDHSADSFLYLPDLDPRWISLDLGDRALSLAAIAPAAQ